MTNLEADFLKFAENRTKLRILEAVFMIELTRSDSNPDFGFYGVEKFTGFQAGFEYSISENVMGI